MPIYEYECPTHGRYEFSQRITESALTVCNVPDCGKPVRKLISSTSFALKGGGWYSDGYGSGAGVKKAGPDRSDAAGAGTAAPAPAAAPASTGTSSAPPAGGGSSTKAEA